MFISFTKADLTRQLALTSSLFLAGCAGALIVTEPGGDTLPTENTEVSEVSVEQDEGPNYGNEAYVAAIEDSKIAEPGETPEQLLVPGDEQSMAPRREVEGKVQVRVATWTNANPYQDYQIGGSLVPSEVWKYAIWVTLEPEAQNFCKAWQPEEGERTDAALTLRLEQRLGIPQGAAKVQFVSMWVNVDDLARPCWNPDIKLDSCSPYGVGDENMLSAGFADGYLQWFQGQTAISYAGDTPYPWTRLGYTYDWSPGQNEVGFSEFLVKPNAEIHVADIKSTAEYCAQN